MDIVALDVILATIKGSTSFLHFLSTLGLTILTQAGSDMRCFQESFEPEFGTTLRRV